MPNSENHQPDSLDIKLSRSEEKYNMLFEYSPVGMAMINHNTGDFHEVNRALLEMTGYTKEEFLQLSFWDITPPEYQEQEEQQRLDLEATGRFGPNEKEYIRKDGSRFPIRIKGFILADVDGTRLVWGIIEDISNEYRRIFDNFQDAYFQTDLTEKVVFANPTALAMIDGEKPDDLIGRPIASFYADPAARIDLYQKLNATGKVKDFITKGVRANGSVFWASINAQFTHNEDGVIVGVEGVVRDVSDRIVLTEKLEQQRNQLAKRLEQSVNTISKISELRDPYTAGHQKRVAELACAIAAGLGLSDEAIHNINVGGLIHDIGKIFIATDILNKPGKITDLEYQILQTHAEHGYHIVSNIDFPADIPTMVYQHHEYLDGTGYPNGLAGDQISIESRILTVADIVEAITSHRPYRASLGIESAFAEIIRYRGSKFDPDVVDACLHLFKDEGFVFSPE